MTEQSAQPTGSLMDGIEFTGRKPLDAGWSARKKRVVGAGSVAVALAAIAGGVAWAVMTRPPGLPKTAAEAVAVMSSDKYDRLDEQRQRQYASEAARLLRELPEEDRRALFADGANRDAMREVGMAMMDEMVLRFARGEEMQMPFGRMGGRPGGGPPGQRPPGDDQQGGEDRRAAMADRINSMLDDQFTSGNAQMTGLRGEFFSSMSSRRGNQQGTGSPGGGGSDGGRQPDGRP